MEQLSTHIYLETKRYQTKQRAHLVFLDLLFLYCSCTKQMLYFDLLITRKDYSKLFIWKRLRVWFF